MKSNTFPEKLIMNKRFHNMQCFLFSFKSIWLWDHGESNNPEYNNIQIRGEITIPDLFTPTDVKE